MSCRDDRQNRAVGSEIKAHHEPRLDDPDKAEELAVDTMS
jgi:hypothetical protein